MFGRALDNIFVYSHYAESPNVSVQTVTLEPDEVLLLVSDGVILELADHEIASCIASDDFPGSTRRSFDAVMENGARDDLCAVLLAR